jgi:rhodanese-related sulfurtransferase
MRNLLQALVLSTMIGVSCSAVQAEDCAGCSAKKGQLPLINRSDLQAQVDHVKMVDALSKDLFDRSHVAGSVNIPMGEESKLAKKLLPDKKADVVVYCMNSSCHAADGVAKKLTKLGYKHVSIYRDGLMDLVAGGFALEGTNPKEPLPAGRSSGKW